MIFELPKLPYSPGMHWNRLLVKKPLSFIMVTPSGLCQ